MTRRQRYRQETMSRQAKAQRQSPERLKISPSEPETVLVRVCHLSVQPYNGV